MRGEETDDDREALTSRKGKGKTGYRAQNKQGIKPGRGEPKHNVRDLILT